MGMRSPFGVFRVKGANQSGDNFSENSDNQIRIKKSNNISHEEIFQPLNIRHIEIFFRSRETLFPIACSVLNIP